MTMETQNIFFFAPELIFLNTHTWFCIRNEGILSYVSLAHASPFFLNVGFPFKSENQFTDFLIWLISHRRNQRERETDVSGFRLLSICNFAFYFYQVFRGTRGDYIICKLHG
jgi:hypothetical protein